MKAIRFLLPLLLVAPAVAGDIDVKLFQYDWPLDSNAIVYSSRAGGIELQLDATHTQFLAQNGGGFVNVAVINNASGGMDWIIQNVPLIYLDTEHMLASKPTLRIGLGDTDGVVWGSTLVATEISAAPLSVAPVGFVPVMPIAELHPFLLGKIDYGEDGPTCDESQAALDAQGGMQGPGGMPGIICAGTIPMNPSDIPAPNGGGGPNCGPASVAGSIAYMAKFRGVPADPVQTIYNELKVKMKTGQGGTTTGDLVDGKNDYTCGELYPICSEILEGLEWTCLVTMLLNAGHDVEAMIKIGNCDDPCTMGHMAMIRTVLKFDDGMTLIETLEPVTDPATGATSWRSIPYLVRHDGKIVDAKGKVIGCFENYFAEYWGGIECLCSVQTSDTDEGNGAFDLEPSLSVEWWAPPAVLISTGGLVVESVHAVELDRAFSRR